MSFPTFGINRFTNINVSIYHGTVQGWYLQLLDLQFGLIDLSKTQSVNYAIKNSPMVFSSLNFSTDIHAPII